MEMSIIDIFFSGDDDVRVDLGCDKCNGLFQWTSSFGKIRMECILLDVQEMVKVAVPVNPVPQKALPAPKGLTQEDKQLLKDMHIKEENDEPSV